MMMSMLSFTIIVVIFGVVVSQNHDVNLPTPYRGMTRKINVDATTAFPPDPTVQDDGMKMLLTRLETLCVEKLEYLITDTNRRFQSLENQLSQSSSCPASQVVENFESLEVRMENLEKQFLKNTQELMGVTRNLSSDVEAIRRNVSSLINVTKTVANSTSNLVSKQKLNEELQEQKDLQTTTTTSCQRHSDERYPRNCREVRECEKTASGIYMIEPEHAPKPFKAVCDLDTRGGGWTVIQRRFDGSQNFDLNWQNYKNGFGNLTSEFWLGLENIHLLTGFEENELLIELGDFESRNISAFYSQFSLGSEVEGYSLKVLGAYSGDAGDSLTDHAGWKFSTADNYQYQRHPQNNARDHHGAWWYNTLAHSNLNGWYYREPHYSSYGLFWNDLNKTYYSYKYTRMLARPKV